ncbi:hypothetical protein TNCV_1011321 [Trichonephila clavipes]|uniref:Uncharacterized protein n=1 Tax=Trichonephila clavipes TaxID=2585209 RepID=A0A8X7BAQ7_TRICX|nr:hypothetical protein TNCV_1011321 [Trichonephila clavipes]
MQDIPASSDNLGANGHLCVITFVPRVQSFFTCLCSVLASPAHPYGLMGHFPETGPMASKSESLTTISLQETVPVENQIHVTAYTSREIRDSVASMLRLTIRDKWRSSLVVVAHGGPFPRIFPTGLGS